MKRQTLVIEISADRFPELQQRAERNHRYAPQEAAAILERALQRRARRDNAGTNQGTNQGSGIVTTNR